MPHRCWTSLPFCPRPMPSIACPSEPLTSPPTCWERPSPAVGRWPSPASPWSPRPSSRSCLPKQPPRDHHPDVGVWDQHNPRPEQACSLEQSNQEPYRLSETKRLSASTGCPRSSGHTHQQTDSPWSLSHTSPENDTTTRQMPNILSVDDEGVEICWKNIQLVIHDTM